MQGSRDRDGREQLTADRRIHRIGSLPGRTKELVVKLSFSVIFSQAGAAPSTF